MPISKEPLAPVYAQNDSAFGDVISWVCVRHHHRRREGRHPRQRRRYVADPPDAEPGACSAAGASSRLRWALRPDAFYQVIKQVGNYNDIFERHLVPVGP